MINNKKLNIRNTGFDANKEIEKLNFELLMVSKLASGYAEFYNPLNQWAAEKIRDRVLLKNKL